MLVESDPTHAGTEKELWVFLPKDPEAFTHDVDGNLLQDGRWNYGWDGENRLIWMESRTDLPTAMPRQRVEFGYDFMSRRNVKRMYIPVAVAEIPGGPLDEPQTVGSTTSVIDGATASVAGPSSDAAPETLPAWAVSAPVGWSQVGLSKYVWDGWNLLAELDITDASVRTFAWGLDLSGSEQGAGGIGGLVLGWTRANGTLGGEVNGTGGNTLRYVFDGNGNVMAALDDLGRVRAKYEYGPFGETLTSEGDLAADNPIRWSTKYTDGESGLVYYGYRYYNAGTGRWLNRDPIEEAGGAALFAFAINAPLTYFDMLGTDFIAVADRPVKGTGGLAYHHSLQYWKADCNPSVGAVLDVSKVSGGKKAESVELLADDGWQVYRWQTSPLQFIVSGQWVLTDVAISTIHYSDSGDRLVPIYASHFSVEVSRRWKAIISQAKAYEYAEQPLPAEATTRTVWRNWPQSEYRIGDIYNNSNAFVREVVSRAQLQMLELPGRHQGRKTAVRVPPPYKYGTTPFRGKPPAMPIGDGGAVGVGYE